MNNHFQLSWRHNEPEFSNVPQLVEKGANQTSNMLVKTQNLIHRIHTYITPGNWPSTFHFSHRNDQCHICLFKITVYFEVIDC